MTIATHNNEGSKQVLILLYQKTLKTKNERNKFEIDVLCKYSST